MGHCSVEHSQQGNACGSHLKCFALGKQMVFCSPGDELWKRTPGRPVCASLMVHDRFCWNVGGEKKRKGKEWTRCLFSESLSDLSPPLFILSCISCVREVLKGIYHSAFHAEIIINPRSFFCFVYFMAKLPGTLILFVVVVVCDFSSMN